MTIRRKTLPALSPKAPAELRPLFAAMAEILETGEGVRGDKLDRKLTLRDLLDGGLAKLRVPGNAEGGLSPAPIESFPKDMSIPPVPTGFIADGSFFGMVNLSWEPPQRRYGNHAFTRIYRSDVDSFGSASVVGMEPGMFYSDMVRDDALVVDDPLNLKGYYYWITFVSASNVEGPPNSPNGTFAQPLPDAAYLLGQLSGQLGESQLEQDLRARIDLIDGIAPGSVNARIATERTERVEGDKATAQLVTTLQTTVSGNTASIQQQATSINGLSAQFTLKTDVNGYVAGFGAYNDGKTADFAVLADRFWIAQPGAASSAVKPFMVVGGKVYIDSAFIRDASIQEGKLGPITFGKLFDSAGRPVTTVGGKLRADMIAVDDLWASFANLDTAVIKTAHIQNASITAAKIKDAEITSAKIQDAAITNAKIGTAEIGTLNIRDGAITISRYFEASNRINLPENSTTTVATLAFNTGNAGGSVIVDVDAYVDIRSDQNDKYHWPVTVSLYRNGALVSSRSGPLRNFTAAQQFEVANLLTGVYESDRDLGGPGWIISGALPLSEVVSDSSQISIRDYSAPAGYLNYQLKVTIHNRSTTPYTWIGLRRLYVRHTKR